MSRSVARASFARITRRPAPPAVRWQPAARLPKAIHKNTKIGDGVHGNAQRHEFEAAAMYLSLRRALEAAGHVPKAKSAAGVGVGGIVSQADRRLPALAAGDGCNSDFKDCESRI